MIAANVRNIIAASLAGAICFASPLAAQGIESKETTDAIVGTQVEEEEADATADAGEVIAAIEKTGEAIGAVRKTSALDRLDIVFLGDAAASEGGPPPQIEAKVAEHEAEIRQLRQEIEGNAMFFHAIDSRRILARDVLAVAFRGEGRVTIYAAAKRPG